MANDEDQKVWRLVAEIMPVVDAKLGHMPNSFRNTVELIVRTVMEMTKDRNHR